MLHDSAAQRLDQILTTLTVLHLRIDLLQRRLAGGEELRAEDRQWLKTALGEIALSVRALTALLGASGGVLETARNDVIASGCFDPPAPQPSLNGGHDSREPEPQSAKHGDGEQHEHH